MYKSTNIYLFLIKQFFTYQNINLPILDPYKWLQSQIKKRPIFTPPIMYRIFSCIRRLSVWFGLRIFLHEFRNKYMCIVQPVAYLHNIVKKVRRCFHLLHLPSICLVLKSPSPLSSFCVLDFLILRPYISILLNVSPSSPNVSLVFSACFCRTTSVLPQFFGSSVKNI